MSMMSYSIGGVGVSVWKLDRPLAEHKEELKNFFLKHANEDQKDYVLELAEGDDSPEAIFEALKSYESWDGAEYSPWVFVAEVMSRETGVTIGYYNSSETPERALMFCSCYPWQLNETEKNLTPDKLEKIFSDYFKELGFKAEVEYQTIQYCG